MSDLSVVIVNWNTCQLLGMCLRSLFEGAPDLALDVLVVDNNSSDGSQAMVQKEFPQVTLIENQENVGFAAANNQAFPLCSADNILLLNPDTQIVGNALGILLDFAQEHQEAGALGPKIVHPEMRLRVLSCGYQPTLKTVFNQYFFLSTIFPRSPHFRGLNLIAGVHDDRVRPVEWLSGACLMVRKRVIEEIGALGEEWFMYAEDMEWCQRMLDAGWKLYHVPEAVVEHFLGSSADQNEEVKTMWVQSLWSYCAHREGLSLWHRVALAFTLVSGLALRAGIYGLRALTDRRRRKMWRAEAGKFAAYALAAARAAASN